MQQNRSSINKTHDAKAHNRNKQWKNEESQPVDHLFFALSMVFVVALHSLHCVVSPSVVQFQLNSDFGIKWETEFWKDIEKLELKFKSSYQIVEPLISIMCFNFDSNSIELST